jgi:hypothetical protein
VAVHLTEVDLADGPLPKGLRDVRFELDDLWDRLLPLTGVVVDSVNNMTRGELLDFLKRALA